MKFEFDPLIYHYPSRRNVIYGRKGMVVTGNPLAANAGLEILKKGGNAIDAAVATAAALTVVEPTANGIGGDAFALVWAEGKLHGLNASGPSPKKISVEALKERGLKEIPTTGVIPVNVPGVPAAWAELWKKFGSSLEFKKLLEPAISYARDGFVIQPGVGSVWKGSFDKFSKALKEDRAIQEWFNIFAPEGKCMKAGDLLRLENHANTLEEIGDTLSESIYRGNLAEKIARFFKENNGFLELSDLEEYYPKWVEPIFTKYKGYEVYQIPPNGHGITVLMALNILKQLELEDMNSFNSTHYQIEALKLAYIDVKKYVSDPRTMKISIDDLLSEEYAKSKAKEINDKALLPRAIELLPSGTVYLAAADQYDNMVSFIQSNYMGFGSGIVIPNTGIAMHNRGCNFNLDKASGNCLEGGKKSYHTIIPGFLMKDGKPVGPYGVMGAFMQPQGHLQVLINTIDYKLNPQDALDRPRWQWIKDKTIEIEQSFDNNLALQLKRAGHDIVVKANSTGFGRGEIIWRDDNGILCGACEPRTDGYVAVW